jgi:hypothetical protein
MNAASPVALVSVMLRFYLAAVSLLVASTVAAQTPPAQPPQERPPLGSSITIDALGYLPAAATLYSLLDTSIPDVIADRIDTGGLSAGEPARVGAHGSSWTQTLFRLGSVNITDPNGNGTPMLVPGVDAWQRVDVATGLMPLDVDAPGLAVSLVPRVPASAAWMRQLDLVGSPAALNAGDAAQSPPPIARLNSWAHASLVAAGAVVPEQIGLFFNADITRTSHFERGSTVENDGDLTSAFGHLVGTPSPNDQVRAIAWVQRARSPVANHVALGQPNAGEQDAAFHGQLAWDHRTAAGNGSIETFGAFTVRNRANDLVAPAAVTIERLRDGPVPDLLNPGVGTDQRWSFGAKFHGTFDSGMPSAHAVVAGVEVGGASASAQSSFAGTVGELVGGTAARVWRFTDPAAESQWSETTFSAYAGDTVAIAPRVTVNGGLRLKRSAARVPANRQWSRGKACCRAPAFRSRSSTTGTSTGSRSTAVMGTLCRCAISRGAIRTRRPAR